jgi:hypothetical protein
MVHQHLDHRLEALEPDPHGLLKPSQLLVDPF